jgi:hypothetical protein
VLPKKKKQKNKKTKMGTRNDMPNYLRSSKARKRNTKVPGTSA